jgi:general L-amino acid transport system substrate-binding protein
MPLSTRLRACHHALIVAGALVLAAPADAASTLDTVRQRGHVVCGVNTGLPGFSFPDAQGRWSGLDVDLCRAVAAAVLGDAGKARYTPLTAQQRFAALQTGEIDLLARNSTITLQRDTALGIQYAGINFYDGQAVAVAKAAGAGTLADLDGAAICVAQGTTHELTISDWFRSHGLQHKIVVYESQDRMYDAFFGGRCDDMTQDSSALAAAIASVPKTPADYRILPDRISKEPLGPFVRKGDDKWLAVVRWVLMAMVEAEELGVTQANLQKRSQDGDPAVRRLLGLSAGNGKALDLDERWAYEIVAQVGNYGESYDRNVGAGSVLKLDRGPNALWTKGGLLYAVPLR